MNLHEIQSALRDQHLDGWLFYDHHHRDPLGLPHPRTRPDGHVTRRWYYFVPASGEPRKLVHRIESGKLDTLPGAKRRVLLLAGTRSKDSKGCSRVHEDRHAVLPAQRHHVRLDGRCRHRRTPARHGQGDRQLRRPRQPVRSRPHRRQIATHYEAQKKLDAILAAGWKQMGAASASGSNARRRVRAWSSSSTRPCAARAWSPSTAPTSPSAPTPPTPTTNPPPHPHAPSATATSSSSTSGPS